MENPVFRKPRMYFETSNHPSHVTFDDGKVLKRNFPWAHYVEARWDYAEVDTIKITIGYWLVVIAGCNLYPLYAAIEDRTLSRLSAQRDFEGNTEHDADSFATEIQFMRAPDPKPKKGQTELDLGLG